MSEAKQSLGRVVFEIKIKFWLRKATKQLKKQNQEITIYGIFLIFELTSIPFLLFDSDPPRLREFNYR